MSHVSILLFFFAKNGLDSDFSAVFIWQFSSDSKIMYQIEIKKLYSAKSSDILA